MDDDSLLQILTERVEKSSHNISFFIFDHLHSCIVHGGDGRTNSDDGNTADDTEKIQNHQIGDFSHESKELVVRIKKITHRLLLPLFLKMMLRSKDARRIVSCCALSQFCPKFEYRRVYPRFYSHFWVGHKGIKPLMCKHNVVYELMTLAS